LGGDGVGLGGAGVGLGAVHDFTHADMSGHGPLGNSQVGSFALAMDLSHHS
jgi:hypothetical protein